MSGVGSRQVIVAPPAQPPLYSLLQAAEVIEDKVGVDPASHEPRVRWQQGIVWAPEQVTGGGVVGVDCHGASPDGKASADNPMVNTADPFTVYAEDHCSTLGFEARDYEGRARRQLLAVQSAKIAHEFQLGALRDSEGLDNVALVDATEVTPVNGPIEVAIGALEAALADKFSGARCMIHVTPQTLVAMMAKYLIYQSGQRWLTAPGNVVVADAGYVAETAPEGAVFAYGTSMVQVRLSPIDVIPGSFSDARARAQMTDRAVNLITIYAERLALVQFDHSDQAEADLLFKVELDLAAWAVGS